MRMWRLMLWYLCWQGMSMRSRPYMTPGKVVSTYTETSGMPEAPSEVRSRLLPQK